MDDAHLSLRADTSDAEPVRTAAPQPGSSDRIKEIILARVASGAGTIARDAAAADLACLAGEGVAPKAWRQAFDRDVATLASAGLMHVLGANLEITDAGRMRAPMLVGGKGPWPKTWSDVLSIRLMAKALGLEGESPAKTKLLAKPDGLRAAILQKSFGIKVKGVPTASRVRSALAVVALERAFGNKIRAGVAGKSGLSAKAGRALAGQLAITPRDFGTDSRLVSALAAEQAGTAATDFAALQSALLRRYVIGRAAPAAVKATKPKRATRRKAGPGAKPMAAAPVRERPDVHVAADLSPALIAGHAAALAAGQTIGSATNLAARPVRPDLPAFASEIRALAATRATGWAGNRKAFISHVWSTVAVARADWGLTEIEFKCMLAEAHRAGHLVLTHSDLKDAATLKDVQASAVSFKNAVFHVVRVDD
jgi:hypothetical protein